MALTNMWSWVRFNSSLLFQCQVQISKVIPTNTKTEKYNFVGRQSQGSAIRASSFNTVINFSTSSFICWPTTDAKDEGGEIIVKPFFDNINIPQDVPLPKFVWERAVNNHGKKAAFIDGISGETQTYEEAFDASRKFGSAIRRLGFKEGEVIAFFLQNGHEYITSLTGVVGVGGVVTTVNPNYTATELARQLEMSDAKMILINSHLIPVVKEALAKVKSKILIIVLDSKLSAFISGYLSYEDVISREDGSMYPEWDDMKIKDDQVVLLPYSSGTTGLPKGITTYFT